MSPHLAKIKHIVDIYIKNFYKIKATDITIAIKRQIWMVFIKSNMTYGIDSFLEEITCMKSMETMFRISLKKLLHLNKFGTDNELLYLNSGIPELTVYLHMSFISNYIKYKLRFPDEKNLCMEIELTKIKNEYRITNSELTLSNLKI